MQVGNGVGMRFMMRHQSTRKTMCVKSWTQRTTLPPTQTLINLGARLLLRELNGMGHLIASQKLVGPIGGPVGT